MSTHKKEPKKMNKTEFVTFMTEHSHHHKGTKALTKADAEKALNWVLDSIVNATKHHHNINITGFGSFGIHHRKSRDGRNPKTGAKMTIPAYNQPVFRAGSKLKEACNHN
ncbi:MAG TPA: HU family DNA-binding protein [Rickettsia endosymbiont of Pyrocoelia pectoralis]|nr:HU family DNA-binding protein [Rickettsia endosymbiont of Pyrocoelia pectoralis]